jgi:DNA topoisomerase I
VTVPRLRHVDCAEPGYSRRRRGRGFMYVNELGEPLDDAAELARIKALVIPPAWENVWICRSANGHLQAVGTDTAGRRQYLYHPVWRAQRDRQKFEEMLSFARALPRLRNRAARQLAQPGLPRDRVLGFAVTVLDRGLFRIGSETYAEENGSYGLTTLERRHVKLLNGSSIGFDFTGKTGRRIVQTITDRRLATIARALKERPGRRKAFLAFENGDGWHDLRAADINAFIKSVTGESFSAKDFRTWHATVLAAASLAQQEAPPSRAARTRAINAAAADVADALGNTPAVCKASYIDPRVFDLYRSGTTISRAVAERNGRGPASQRARERAVLSLLERFDAE